MLAAVVTAAPAIAHVTKRSGAYEIEMGWGEEPTQVGSPNFVEVIVSDLRGPLAVPAGALSVEVSYGGSAVTLPLVPNGAPGTLEAPLTPTRPGAYSFDVSGRVDGQPVHVRASCSESTFNCVETSAGPEFPVKDPSAGQLAQRLSSETNRVENASDQADSARTIALFAAIPAALGLALGGFALFTSIRSRRRQGG